MYGICTTFIAAEKIEAGEACFVGSDGRLRKVQSTGLVKIPGTLVEGDKYKAVDGLGGGIILTDFYMNGSTTDTK